MKKHFNTLSIAVLLLAGYACSNDSNAYEPVPKPDTESPTPDPEPEPEPEPILELDAIPASAQRIGDVAKGYDFLINGNYMSSGVPYDAFVQGFGQDNSNVLERSGDNAIIGYEYTAVDAANGVRIVSPNCMSCHAGLINNEFIVGLGSHAADFTINRAVNMALVSNGISFLYGGQESNEWEAFDQFRKSIEAIGEKTLTETRGANPADKITRVLASHRDKNSLEWTDTPYVNVSDEVIPTDVPAWWLLKKKNAMFYHAIGRKDFCKSFIGSSLLTLDDKTKAEEIDPKMPDVLAYIYSIEAPEYPFEIDTDLAAQGKPVFEENCVKCHGSYGETEEYPNLLVSLTSIGTDPALSNLYTTPSTVNEYFLDWFNTGWFGTGTTGLEFKAEGGYIAPPLDGVWATAPYFHNGSVATIAEVLNSSERPKYWSRSFNSTDYDKENLGWNYTVETSKVDKETYDTTIKGYGNQGHNFGDELTSVQRLALLEYLKTL
ncbi:c-type cytochrome [Zobellia roscoffensis]|uniref:c-type cytochrome n=1 Tax=Zobellia roscoffensis TaxID=2779508 RepID=UPI00188BF1FE|nr:c-type cytochrome [Zobellia roscoffensis]